MSESIEQEMLRRARTLCETRGKRVDRLHHDWFRDYRADRLHLSIREEDDQVLVCLSPIGSINDWAVYYPDLDPADDNSIYLSEQYEECVELMRAVMVLDDLADV